MKQFHKQILNLSNYSDRYSAKQPIALVAKCAKQIANTAQLNSQTENCRLLTAFIVISVMISIVDAYYFTHYAIHKEEENP